MPPQGVALAGALVWNYSRSKRGKVTISMFLRRHPAATAVGLVVGNAWIIPHLFRAP